MASLHKTVAAMPNAVLCSLCGGKFFKSSLAHHQKVCREKVGRQCHECPYCHGLFPMLEMDDHIRTCPAAQAAGAKPTGASAALARRLCDHKRRLENGIPEIAEERTFGGNCMGSVEEYADADDTRIACKVCGRKFAMDRIGKHQAICQKIASKPRRRPKQITKNTAPMPLPTKSNWRKQSADFQAAARAGRGCPLPTWGNSSGSKAIVSRPANKPAAGSALSAIRQKSSPGKYLQVPTPQMSRSGAFRRSGAPHSRSRSPLDNGSRQHRSRSSSTGALRANTSHDPLNGLPAWGSGGPSKYGRECMTSPPVRKTPHNTSWGGCTRVGAQEKEGFESNRCSFGNPLDRSWLYESRDSTGQPAVQKKNSTIPHPAPRGVSAAPVLLGRCRGNDSRRVKFA